MHSHSQSYTKIRVYSHEQSSINTLNIFMHSVLLRSRCLYEASGLVPIILND